MKDIKSYLRDERVELPIIMNQRAILIQYKYYRRIDQILKSEIEKQNGSVMVTRKQKLNNRMTQIIDGMEPKHSVSWE